MNEKLFPPIFLFGCPRSGTTLLQSLLAAHPDIYSLPETKFFQFAIPSYRRETIRAILGLISKNLLPRLQYFFCHELERPDLLSSLPHTPLLSLYSTKFIEILDQLTLEAGKQVWLEKTPEHIFCIRTILSYLPSARFIHLVRQPTDVIASLYEITPKYPGWGGAWDLEQCIKRWQDCLKITCKYLNHSHHLLVKYEDLVGQPQKCLQKICDFLEISFTEEMLENYGDMVDHLTMKSCRSVNKRGILSNGSDKYNKIFNDQEKAFIQKKLLTTQKQMLLIGMSD